MKRYLHKCLGFLFGEWEYFHIYYKNSQPSDFIVNQLRQKNITLECVKLKKEKFNYALLKDNVKVCTCLFIWGDEYKFNFRNFINLKKTDVKIARVETDVNYRGQGLAGLLLDSVAKEANQLGFNRLVAIIWHSNKSSVKAFKKNGWKFSGVKIQLVLFNLVPIGLTLRLPRKFIK